MNTILILTSFRIEDIQILSDKFNNDYQQLDAWLARHEEEIKNPNTVDVSYSDAKAELKKFEVISCTKHS